MKRLFALISLLAFCLLCAPGVLAESAVYLDENGQQQTYPTAMVVTANDTGWTGTDTAPGWYVVTGTVEIPRRVTVTGDVHLILGDNASLTVKGGIEVAGGNSLTIYAQSTDPATMGRLTANGYSDYAGIGGNCNGIYGGSGGIVTATSSNGAGIGGGSGNYGGSGGNVTISGGIVTATGSNGAGIGGGSGHSTAGSGGSVTIYGGSVNASSTGGAGIGGGSSNSTAGSGGTVTISGGNVTAIGGSGAGIGGGNGASGGSGGTVTINGGTVNARSTDGAGIGGGYGASGGSGGNVTISGGNVTAIGGNGAGIGGRGGTVTINGGSVTATGGDNGAGIGGGYGGSGGTVTISGGNVTATGGDNGAGIGGGFYGSGGTVTINGGSVTATGGDSGAGIGGGFNGSSGSLTIGPAADGKMLTVTAGDSETNAQEVPGSAFTEQENIIDKVSSQAWFRSEEVTRDKPAPSGVTLSQTELSLFVGASETLTATVAPEDAGDRNVTWKSNDESIAKVENGTVTAVAPGTATITATTSDGNRTATCTVTVTRAVTGITLEPAEVPLFAGDSTTLNVTVAPENATNKVLLWTSDKPEIAIVTVGGDGTITVNAKAPGTATITADATDGSGVTATCKVTVTAKTYGLSANVSAINFGNVFPGYTQPGAQTFTVTNTGNQTLSGLTLSSPTNFAAGNLSAASVEPGKTVTFTVQPKAGLGVGSYSESITLTGTNDTKLTVIVSFTVVQAPASTPAPTPEPPRILLHFNTMGGLPLGDVSFGQGAPVELWPYTPVRPGYLFQGWYKDQALTQPVTKIVLVDETTLYAKWAVDPAAQAASSGSGSGSGSSSGNGSGSGSGSKATPSPSPTPTPTATPTPAPSPTPEATATPEASLSPTPAPEADAGTGSFPVVPVAVGAGILILLAAGLIWFFRRG